jgi:peptide/nickel transport system substrate-binding protein
VLLRDVRFHRAISLAIDRQEINRQVYAGSAIIGQNTILPQSPLYDPHYRSAWADFDVRTANLLLDKIGMTKWNRSFLGSIRVLPDGRPMEIIVEGSPGSTEQLDILELIKGFWSNIGIRLFHRPLPFTTVRQRVISGQTLMSIDSGINDALATAAMSPREFAPTSHRQLEWPSWGRYYETTGEAGEPPDLPSAVRLRELYEKWLAATSGEDKSHI